MTLTKLHTPEELRKEFNKIKLQPIKNLTFD